MTTQDEMEKKIKALQDRIEQLTTFITEMYEKEQKEIHYHIKHLEIHSAEIEKLEYHLDSIGIEKLSGTLNIGNNFDSQQKKSRSFYSDASKEHPSQKTKQKTSRTPRNLSHKSSKPEQPVESSRIKVSNSERGFSIALHQKGEK